MRVQFFRRREWATLRKLDGFRDILFHFSLDGARPFGVELSSNDLELIHTLPFKQFIPAAITRIVVLCGTHMFTPAVCMALDERGSAFRAPHAGYGVPCQLTNRQ